VAIIRVVDVCVRYGKHQVLKNISLNVMPGEVVSVLGPNGSGKTTLLRTIDGILKPYVGSVYIDGKNVRAYVRRELAKIVGYVPQRINIFTKITVLDFVLTGRRPFALFSYSKIDVAKAVEVLEAVDAGELMHKRLDELSSGQLQRVVIARALAIEPKVLLLDEPTSNLDPRYQLEILKLVKSLSKEKRIAVLMSVHDLTHAYRFSDKIVLLKNGEIVAAGKPDDVLTEENILKVFSVKAKLVKEIKAIVIDI